MPVPSYIELQLPELLRNALHEIATSIAKNYEFCPIDRDKLHCTVAFYGSVPTKGPPDESRRLLQSMQMACSDEVKGVRIARLALFPPGKQNLVVAILDVPAEWHDHRRRLSKLDSSMDWVPHVTLGKFKNGGPHHLPTIDISRVRYFMPFHLSMAGPVLRGSRAAK